MGLLNCLLAAVAAACMLGSAGAAAPVAPDTMAQRALACTGCHQTGDSAVVGGYIPRIAGKPAGYLYEQLLNFRDGRRANAPMARLLENLGDEYLRELADHFAALDVPYAPTPRARPSPTSPAAQRAAAWVRQGDPQRGIPACVQCHGQALTGIAPHVPGLIGLPGDYLTGQLGAWRNGVRHGRAPDCMARIAGRLPAEAIPEIAAWLAAQPMPARPTAATTPPPSWPLSCGSIRP